MVLEPPNALFYSTLIFLPQYTYIPTFPPSIISTTS